MADYRTKNQTNRATEAAVEATKAGARASADVSRKGAETAQRAVEASVEQAEQTTRKGVEVAQRTIEASADQARHVAEASGQEAQRGLDRSSRQLSTVANQAAREGTQRTSENLGVVMQVVTTAASGYHSVVTEVVEQGQQAFQRNVDAFNQALRVRSTSDLLNIQTRYLHDSLGAVLNTSARISEISAKTATEAAGKLQQCQSA